MAKTLLLADDNPTIQRVVALTFANEDITVIPVADGELAVDAMIQSPPDIVLADIAMPGRGGYELADFVRHSPALAHIPVLLLAGAFETVDTARAHAVGASGILTKPFDPAVVIGRVRELLNQAPPAASSSAPAPAVVPGAEATISSSVASPVTDAAASPDMQLPSIELVPQAPDESADELADGYAEMDVDDELPLASGAPPVDASEVDRYFDSVDHAFTQLTLARRPLSGLSLDESGELPDLPLSPLPDDVPPPVVEAPASAPAALTDWPDAELPTLEPPAAATPVAASPVSLTDAFNALLAAESGVTAPTPQPPVAVTAPAVDIDALAEQVARRVLERLSDRVVRETVADIVLSTAERLVREEIDRITRNIT